MNSKDFDAPIPGQSLTDIPGNAKWEKPPRFVKLNDALEFLWDKFSQPKQTAKLLVLLDSKIPAKSIVEATLFAGFTEGAWTPDLMVLMARPVYTMVHAIGEKAGIKVVSKFKEKDDIRELVDQLGEVADAANEEPEPEPDDQIGSPAPLGNPLDVLSDAPAPGQAPEQQAAPAMPATGLMGAI